MFIIIRQISNFKFHVSENACTDRFVVQEDTENEQESCLEQCLEINAISSSPASTKDEGQLGEGTLSLDPEDNTKTQDTLLGKFNYAH